MKVCTLVFGIWLMVSASAALACGDEVTADAAALDKKAELFKKAADCVRGAADEAAKKECLTALHGGKCKKKSCCMKKS